MSILEGLRQAAKQAEENVEKNTNTAFDKARARATATTAAHVPDELLRALGARGRGLDSEDRPYGLALLQIVADVATEAFACGERSQGKMRTYMKAPHNRGKIFMSLKYDVLESLWLRELGRGERHSCSDIFTTLPLI